MTEQVSIGAAIRHLRTAGFIARAAATAEHAAIDYPARCSRPHAGASFDGRAIAATLAGVGTGSTMIDYRSVITIEPGKRGGRPCVRGLRITVADVLGWLAAGLTPQAVLDDHPDLTDDDIRACLAWAADRERRLSTAAE